MNSLENIKTIAFDADDTLWVNEPYFREVEDAFCVLLKDYLPTEEVSKELFKTEMSNLSFYGYGVKGFILSMIETIARVTNNKADIKLVNEVIDLGKGIFKKPAELLEGVEEVLERLHGNYRLVMATKGDLLDQERKLILSGLEKYFHHIEVMSNKKTEDFQKLIKHLDCKPDEFLMVGNSLKSDILPVLEIGAKAIHVPYHTTWIHEEVDSKSNHSEIISVEKIADILTFVVLTG